jgi:outer membrane biosynthesis protein TonB
MPRGSTRRRSEIVDSINAALEIVDEVTQDGDGDLVRAVVAGFTLKQILEGNYEDDREDEEQAPEEDDEEQAPEDEEEQDGEDEEPEAEEEPEEEAEEEPEEEPEPPKRSRGRSSTSGSRSSRAKK